MLASEAIDLAIADDHAGVSNLRMEIGDAEGSEQRAPKLKKTRTRGFEDLHAAVAAAAKDTASVTVEAQEEPS